jgi:hypothetical protein
MIPEDVVVVVCELETIEHTKKFSQTYLKICKIATNEGAIRPIGVFYTDQ